MEQEMENNKVEDQKIEDKMEDKSVDTDSSQNDDDVESKKNEASEEKSDTKIKTNGNKMREIEIEKIILHAGGVDDKLEKSKKLLETISGSKKIYVIKSTKRIPAFGISPGKQSGCKITIRDKEKIDSLLKRFFTTIDDFIPIKQVSENQVCFGIPEYIEIPGMEYDRDIGILGFEIMIVFKRKGKRVKMKKIQRGRYPKKQNVTKEEIIEYLIKNYDLEVE